MSGIQNRSIQDSYRIHASSANREMALNSRLEKKLSDKIAHIRQNILSPTASNDTQSTPSTGSSNILDIHA